MPQRRVVVLRNLRIAFYGEYDMPALKELTREIFRRTGANLLSAAHTAHLDPREVDANLVVENPELLQSVADQGKGVVLMPPHMGNWEILSRMNRLFPQGHAVGAFYRPLNNPLLNERIIRQRKADGTHLFSKRDSFHAVAGFLREGGLVGILADQRVGKQGELVRFFGRLTRASPLPSLMIRRSKSGVVPISLITESPGKWRVRYHTVNPPFKTPDCMAALEQAMRASLLDVFWFQDRWKVFVSSRFTIRDWLGPEIPGESKPHRALLWLAGHDPTWRIPEEWKHQDVNYEVVLAPGQASPEWLDGQEIIHRVRPSDTYKTLRGALADIDGTTALPVDYIVTRKASGNLKKAAKFLSIRLVSLVR